MSFDPFGDRSTRGYLRNHARAEESSEVAELANRAFRLNLPKALAALRETPTLGYGDLLSTHAILFGDVYDWAGRDRATTAPGIAIARAGRPDLFCHPLDSKRAGTYAFDEAAKPGRMAARPGEIMGMLAYAHPFLDGNGRTIMTVHAELCRRAGIAVDWTRSDKNAYLAALTSELENPGKGALDAHVKPLVVAIDPRLGLAEALVAVKGLNPEPTIGQARIEERMSALTAAGIDGPIRLFLGKAELGRIVSRFDGRPSEPQGKWSHVARAILDTPRSYMRFNGRTGLEALQALHAGFGSAKVRSIEIEPAGLARIARWHRTGTATMIAGISSAIAESAVRQAHFHDTAPLRKTAVRAKAANGR